MWEIKYIKLPKYFGRWNTPKAGESHFGLEQLNQLLPRYGTGHQENQKKTYSGLILLSVLIGQISTLSTNKRKIRKRLGLVRAWDGLICNLTYLICTWFVKKKKIKAQISSIKHNLSTATPPKRPSPENAIAEKRWDNPRDRPVQTLIYH